MALGERVLEHLGVLLEAYMLLEVLVKVPGCLDWINMGLGRDYTGSSGVQIVI